MSLVLDHLFQSTLVMALIGLATLFFRGNGAPVRHALWTAASLKFLLPFALLSWAGHSIARAAGLALPGQDAVETLFAAGQPFSDGPVFRAMPMPSPPIFFMILGAWFASIIALLLFWFSRWWTLRATLRAARDAGIAAPLPVRISPAQLEPGLVGVFRPVLLLPEGITERLTAAELQAVIVHEACHMRRRDNLWAALHMLAEALYWFWPPVWWLGARLVAERERACDEAVLAAGSDPETYATSILKVCKFYVQSPLVCAAGVSGANLNHRMETIMENKTLVRLNAVKKTLLAASAAALVLTPILGGAIVASAQAAVCKLDGVMNTHTLPPYPEDSKKAGEEGTVMLRVTVAADGHATRADVTHGSGFVRLDEAAAIYVQRNYRWRPNACRSTQTPLKVVFKLEHGPDGRITPK